MNSRGSISNRWIAVLAVAALSLLALLYIPTRSYAIELLGLILFWGGVVFVLWDTSVAAEAKAALRNKPLCIALLVVIALFLIFASWYLGQYHFYPYWDNLNYWRQARELNSLFATDVTQALKNICNSINISNYNQLLAWVISLPARLFPSWTGMAFIDLALFQVPAACIVALFIVSKLKEADFKISKYGLLAIYICCLLPAVYLWPGFRNMPDCAGYVYLAAGTAALFDKNLTKSWHHPICAGIGLCGAFFLRRYFVFADAGLAVAALVYWLIYLFRLPAVERAPFFKRLLLSAGIIAVVAVLLFLLFPGFAQLTLFGNQGTAYNAWTSMDTIALKVAQILTSMGYGWPVLAGLALCALIVLVLRKKIFVEQLVTVFQICLTAFVAIAVALLLFWRIQDLGNHHWYIFVMMLEVLVALPIAACIATLRTQTIARLSLTTITVMFSLVSLLSGFSITQGDVATSEVATTILCSRILAPYKQNDLEAKELLVDFLDENTNDGEVVYFAAASANLNSYLPLSVVMTNSDTAYTDPFLCARADVDSRDGFDTRFFTAKYVVASNPVSLHMKPENEQGVVTLNSWVQDQSSMLGSHYSLANTHAFDGDVIVKVYERTADFTAEEVKEVEAYFDELFPDWPALFHDRFEAYLAELGTE